MTAVVTPKTLTEWLADLQAAATSEDRVSIGVAACGAGMQMQRVICTRCENASVGLTFSWAVQHLNAPYAVPHEPGDLQPAPPRPVRPWARSTCRGKACRAPIIWATSTYGNKMPVDATPDPVRGTVVLEDTGGADAPVARVVIHAERDRAALPSDTHLYLHHRASCTDPARARKKKGSR